MAAQIGRKLKIKRDDTVIAGVQTRSITINNEPVDVTTDDSEGFRELLEDSATRSIDLSVEGLTKDTTLIQHAIDGDGLIESYEIEFEDTGDTITGSFRLNNMEIGAEHEGARTFTAELQSTGEFTFTPDSQ